MVAFTLMQRVKIKTNKWIFLFPQGEVVEFIDEFLEEEDPVLESPPKK